MCKAGDSLHPSGNGELGKMGGWHEVAVREVTVRECKGKKDGAGGGGGNKPTLLEAVCVAGQVQYCPGEQKGA